MYVCVCVCVIWSDGCLVVVVMVEMVVTVMMVVGRVLIVCVCCSLLSFVVAVVVACNRPPLAHPLTFEKEYEAVMEAFYLTSLAHLSPLLPLSLLYHC